MAKFAKQIAEAARHKVAGAVSLAVQWIDAGFDLVKVDEEVQRLRFTICQNCPSKKYDATDKRCLECGCPNMDFKTTLKYDPIKTGTVGKRTEVVCPNNHW